MLPESVFELAVKRESVRNTGPLNTEPEPLPSEYDLDYDNDKNSRTTQIQVSLKSEQ